MNALLLAAGVFVVLGVSTGLGMVLRDRLPSNHLNSESKEVIRLAPRSSALCRPWLSGC